MDTGMFKVLRNFAASETGAVTVDWVVLTAAIVGLGIAVIATVEGGVNGLGDKIAGAIGTSITVGDGFLESNVGAEVESDAGEPDSGGLAFIE